MIPKYVTVIPCRSTKAQAGGHERGTTIDWDADPAPRRGEVWLDAEGPQSVRIAKLRGAGGAGCSGARDSPPGCPRGKYTREQTRGGNRSRGWRDSHAPPL